MKLLPRAPVALLMGLSMGLLAFHEAWLEMQGSEPAEPAGPFLRSIRFIWRSFVATAFTSRVRNADLAGVFRKPEFQEIRPLFRWDFGLIRPLVIDMVLRRDEWERLRRERLELAAGARAGA